MLHRRVAEALEKQVGEAPIERLAYHYTRSTEQAKAALYLEQAGDQARTQGANATAETYYAAAVERLDRLGRTLAAAQVREKLGEVLATLARYETALAVLEQAAQTYQRAGALEALRRTLAAIAGVHGDRAAPEEGLERVQPLLPVLATTEPSPGLAMLCGTLASSLSLCGRYGESVAAAERSAEIARAVHDDLILAGAEGTRGQSLLLLGRVDEALHVLEEAIRLAEVAHRCEEHLSSLMNAAAIHDDRGEFERSRWYVERTVALAERTGAPNWIASTLALRGLVAFHTGDWVRARADGERAMTLSHEIGPSNGFIFPRVWLGQLCVAEGAWDEASRYLEEAAALTARSRQLRKLRWAQGTLADLDVRRGHAEAALARLAPLLDRPGLQEYDVTMFLPVLAEAHLMLDDVAEARQVVTQAITRARTGCLRRALVEGLRVQALVAIRQEQWPDAECSLQEGLALARNMACAYAEARVLQVSGEMYVQRRESALARKHLQAAHALFQRLGARQDTATIQQAMRHL